MELPTGRVSPGQARRLVGVGCLSLLAACGGGGGQGSVAPAGPVPGNVIQVIQQQPSTSGVLSFKLRANSEPSGVALGGDSNYWVTETAAGRIARVTDTGTYGEFAFKLSHAPQYIAPGPSGTNVWTVDTKDDVVAQVSSGGVIKEYQLPSGSAPQQLVRDNAGNVWITESGTNAVAELNAASGTIATFALPSGSQPYGIAYGPDANLWITEPGIHAIATLVPSSGATTQHALQSGRVPTSITSWDGYLWFGVAQTSAAYVGRMSTSGGMVQYATSAGQAPQFLTGGPLSSLWYTTPAQFTSALFSSGLTFQPTLQTLTSASQVIVGNDGNLWFPDAGQSALDVYVIRSITATPSSISFSAVTQAQTFSAGETHYSGNFFAKSSNAAVASVSPASGSTTFTVTANAAGTATITVSDNAAFPKAGNGTTISVNVTTTSITVN